MSRALTRLRRRRAIELVGGFLVVVGVVFALIDGLRFLVGLLLPVP